jgi:hypothetical protein
MDIWKVSERAILTIQRIVRVSPEPRFCIVRIVAPRMPKY